MNIEEMLDIFDIDEIEKMSPEECKGLLKGFFIGAGFVSIAIESGYGASRKHSVYEPYKPMKKDPAHQDFRRIELEFDDRKVAQEILDDLQETLEARKEGYVTVRDLYSIAELPTNLEMTHRVWYDLEDCKIERNGDNYILKMPPAELKNPYRG